ncbi:MAG TPA: histidine phosphatase family protein [Acidimicrobiales bacterium]|nr:histidine phosphatase family protein [Acidimicrobiales bacterium]
MKTSPELPVNANNGPIAGPVEVVLVRHGSTEWSTTGRHTGRTDVPLDEGGRGQAARLAARLEPGRFAQVYSSPLRRAFETCRLAGLGKEVELLDDLVEWDYGDFEGRTTAAIRAEHPGWQLFDDGCPNGETAEDVGRRADRVIARLVGDPSAQGASVVLFAHGHLLRVLAARWLGLAPTDGRLLTLAPASVSELGYEREVRVIDQWNA